MKNNNTPEEIYNFLLDYDSYVIIGHILPDGDNIGSVLGLAYMMQQLGKKVYPVANGDIPDYCNILPGIECLASPDTVSFDNTDAVIILDTGSLDHSGEFGKNIPENEPVLNIDHHKTNTFYGNLNYVLPVSSTGEILTELFLKWSINLTYTISKALYMAIFTDTGSFGFASVTPRTLYIASRLLEYGIRPEEVRCAVLEQNSFIRQKLKGLVLSNAALSSDRKCCYSLLTYEEIHSLSPKSTDFENVVNELVVITGVEVGIFIREQEKGTCKISFRGRGNVDVSSVARSFGGGGHKAAAGATVDGNPLDILKKILDCIEKI